MKEIIKLGFTLFLFSVLAAFILSVTNELTKDKIIENGIQANIEARQEVFPDADDFLLLEDEKATEFYQENTEVLEIYKALKDSVQVGFVIKTAPNGYGGAVIVTIGFDLDGVLTGVRVGDHQETPGLGANAKTEKFYSQYDGLSILSDILVIKTDVTEGNNEIKAISGATITSSAVTRGVNYCKLVIETFK